MCFAVGFRGAAELLGDVLARVRERREPRPAADLCQSPLASGLPGGARMPELRIPGGAAVLTLVGALVQRVPGLADATLLDDVLPVVTVDVPAPPRGQVRRRAGNDQRRASDADDDQPGEDAVPDRDHEQAVTRCQTGHRQTKPGREQPDYTRQHRQRDDARDADPDPRRM